jgi:hypothetical protein
MSGSTPGPLSVRQSEKWPFDLEIIDEEGNVILHERLHSHSTDQKTITDAMSGKYMGKHEELAAKVNQKQLANMRLWAAAPDLLAALQLVIKYDECDSDRGVDMMLLYAEAIQAARAGIVKATGEQA